VASPAPPSPPQPGEEPGHSEAVAPSENQDGGALHGKSDPTIAAPLGTGFLARLSDTQMSLGIIGLGLALYVPMAGSYGLFDPWETHYGEVARQMTTRGDAISLWWPGAPLDADHFWSKPVLSFWLMSLFMGLFGVAHGPSGSIALGSRAEWAMRLPICAMGVLGIWAVYLCLARFAGRRAGVLGAVVLATSPMYSLVARQAMTDMPFVGPMTMALCLAFFALSDKRDQELPRRRWAALEWPHDTLYYVTVGAFVVTTLPQLILNTVQLSWPLRFGTRTVTLSGAVVMLPYFLGFLGFLKASARLRYRAPFYLCLAAILCGLATLAKGLAGLGLPVLVFLAYLTFTGSWKRFSRAQLGQGLLLGFLACAVVAVPWHHAMLIRHGFPFWDELYGDNHWRRMITGRHGDRGTFEYFLRELGYAVLPWVGIGPAAIAAAVLKPARPGLGQDVQAVARQRVLWFGATWFVVAYALVSLSVTKFHHYILPALPGLAMVIAWFLDDLLRRRAHRTAMLTAALGLGVWAVVTADLVDTKNAAQHFIWLFSYDYVNAPKGRPWPEPLDFRTPLVVFAASFAALTVLFAWRRLQAFALVALGVVAVAFSGYLLDHYMPATAHYWSQKPLIATYYKTRRSPQERLLVWQMYWRGENFYTANEIYEGPKEERTVFLGDKNVENLKDWVAKHRGRRAFLLVERSRYGQVPAMFPENTRPSLHVIDESNMKFVLAQVDL